MVNSTRLYIMVNQFCFETGCFVLNWAFCLCFECVTGGIFKIANIVKNKVTKHKRSILISLAGRKPSTCTL